MASQSQDLGGPLKATIDRRDGATSVVLTGYINDATDLGPLQRLPGTLRVDLAGVERINSVGVRIWVHFVRDREKAGGDLICERCSPVIVQQIGEIIRTLKQKGFTILLVEQNFHFASTVADRHYVVEHGTVVDMIPNAALEANAGKLRAYLGV